MKGILLLIIIVGIAAAPYILRRILNVVWDKTEDKIRNDRIEHERQSGHTNNKVANLSDRYTDNMDE